MNIPVQGIITVHINVTPGNWTKVKGNHALLAKGIGVALACSGPVTEVRASPAKLTLVVQIDPANLNPAHIAELTNKVSEQVAQTIREGLQTF